MKQNDRYITYETDLYMYILHTTNMKNLNDSTWIVLLTTLTNFELWNA